MQKHQEKQYKTCRCGARGGMFSTSGCSTGVEQTPWILQHAPSKTGVCWRGKKEKDWQNEGSAWREWLWCGNLSISEAQKRLCLDKSQGKQHHLCLAGLHSDSYSWSSVQDCSTCELCTSTEITTSNKHSSWTQSCERISAGTKNQTRYRQLTPQKSLLKPELYNVTIYSMLQLKKKKLKSLKPKPIQYRKAKKPAANLGWVCKDI